ncbi:uncharacterized protein OCT59_009718 [Rhizophagus irregularis]|uniref:uncharacterized protein n=1 Tax=Rhizophagus irregularis TaxID=588596 RepID=UPI003321B1F6|nr:hypothetical protein OCT59_009718 [Rhizophagus irregularis]
MDNFIFENGLKWIPYDKLKNIEYLDKGGFGIIYKATWLFDNYTYIEVILKCHKKLSENSNEFLNEWEYHRNCLSSNLMKKCWDEDPSKRPSANEVLDIIEKWIYYPKGKKIKNIKDINKELKCNIMEFINAPIEQNNNIVIESHPQACYTSRLLDFSSKELNDILESENLNECII